MAAAEGGVRAACGMRTRAGMRAPGGGRREVGWRTAFGELVEFARRHAAGEGGLAADGEPGVRVTPHGLDVPRELREEFYERVHRVRRALGEAVLGTCGRDRAAGDSSSSASAGGEPGEASEPCVRDDGSGLADWLEGSTGAVADGRDCPSADGLVQVARACAGVRDEVVAATGLVEFRLASMLEDFLADPLDTVTRPLQRQVVEALQSMAPTPAPGRGPLRPGGAPAVAKPGLSRVDAEDSLLARARELVAARATMLYRNAYEAWAYYGVVAALRPRTFYAVLSPDMNAVHAVRTDAVTVATQPTSPNLRLPECLFVTEDGRTFAMKTEAAHELDFYGFRNKRRRDNSAGGDTANLMTHRVLLLWHLANKDAVDFVADRERMRVTPTDLTCEVLTPAEMATPAYVSAFAERARAVRSRRPVQVFALGESGEFPAGMLDDPGVPKLQVRRVEPGSTDGASLTFAEVAALLDEGANPRAEARALDEGAGLASGRASSGGVVAASACAQPGDADVPAPARASDDGVRGREGGAACAAA